MPGSNGQGFLVILKKSSELRFGLWWSKLIFCTWARPVQCGMRGVRTHWFGQWVESWRWTNNQHRKICVSLSLCWKPNLKKIIKVSYLSQESRKCFSDSYAYDYNMNIMNVFTYLYISRINIWVCYTTTQIIIKHS